MKDISLIFLILFVFTIGLYAKDISSKEISNSTTLQQPRTITGVVSDEKGEALLGLTIHLKGTSVGTVTDIDGKYTIAVPNENATLVYSFIGFVTQEIVVGSRNTINVIMVEDSKLIDEVVVVGYGTQKRSQITAAISSIKESDFNSVAAPASVLELAQGKLPGVTITFPNGTDPRGEVEILIRGAASLSLGMRPLIVIDGVPGGDLSLIQPEDVESFDVLKDASAAAIYGTRGANGVILVTTKRGKVGERKPTYEYSTFVSHSYIYRQPKVLSTEQYREYMGSGIYNTQAMVDYGGNTDWQAELIDKNNLSHNHNLSLSGGSGRTGYRASIFYRDFNPIAKETDQSNWGGRLSVNHWGLNDKLDMQVNLSANFIDRNMVGENSAFEQAAQRNPTQDPKDANGNWIEDQGDGRHNPLARMAQRDDYQTRTTILGSAKATLHITKDLNASVLGAWQQWDDLRNQYLYRDSKESKDSYAGGGRAQKWMEKEITKTVETTIDYSNTFNGIHYFSVVLGHSYQYGLTESFNAWNTGFQTDIYGANHIGSGTGIGSGASYANMESDKFDNKLAAVFGRINYVLHDKYQFQAILRHEGSSRFGQNNRWGTFPALSAGWVISKERFLKDVDILNNLKIRAGYGVTGNQEITNYIYMSTLATNSTYPVDGSWISSYRPSRNPNPDLKWERKSEFNFGLDFSLLSNRLNGTIDIYNRSTKDVIEDFETQLPPFVISTIYTNVGEISNKGFEIGLSGTPVRMKDFQWDVNATFAYQKNKLVSYSNDAYKGTYKDDYEFGGVGYLGYAIRTQEGGALGTFYGRRFAGVSENGEWMFYNKDNVAVLDRDFTDDDKTWLGNGTPKYYASLGNTFRYKNFDLSIFLRGKFGFKILNTKEMYFGSLSTLPMNVLETALTKHSDIRVPVQYSDYYLEDGGFVKIDNITLGYTVPMDNKWVNDLRVYVTAQNLATFTKYTGTTPEVRDSGLTAGVDTREFYPVVSTMLFGLKFGF